MGDLSRSAQPTRYFRLIYESRGPAILVPMKSGLAALRTAEVGAPTWFDRIAVVVLLPLAALETATRSGITWPPIALALAVIAILSLLGRRQRPFAMVMVAFGGLHIARLATIAYGLPWHGLNTNACILLLPYALVRRARGRRLAVGLLFIFIAPILPLLAGDKISHAIGGTIILAVPTTIGAIVRWRAESRQRELERAKTFEREQIARELHDTLAHHMSAIAVQAQAGRTLAKKTPEAAVSALDVIEEAAARALTDMRRMVRMLRQDGPGEREPQSTLADIQHLVDQLQSEVPIDLDLRGPTHTVEPIIESAVYRIVQESLTNAVRHALHPTKIEVRVDIEPHVVHLSISDDGESRAFDAHRTQGFGLVGMAERTHLLGGTFTAGPGAAGGWRVDATLPRRGSRT